MSLLRTALRELIGLFVDDWLFALAIAVWLALIVVANALSVGAPQSRGIVLFVGLAAILLGSVLRAARHA